MATTRPQPPPCAGGRHDRQAEPGPCHARTRSPRRRSRDSSTGTNREPAAPTAVPAPSRRLAGGGQVSRRLDFPPGAWAPPPGWVPIGYAAAPAGAAPPTNAERRSGRAWAGWRRFLVPGLVGLILGGLLGSGIHRARPRMTTATVVCRSVALVRATTASDPGTETGTARLRPGQSGRRLRQPRPERHSSPTAAVRPCRRRSRQRAAEALTSATQAGATVPVRCGRPDTGSTTAIVQPSLSRRARQAP